MLVYYDSMCLFLVCLIPIHETVFNTHQMSQDICTLSTLIFKFNARIIISRNFGLLTPVVRSLIWNFSETSLSLIKSNRNAYLLTYLLTYSLTHSLTHLLTYLTMSSTLYQYYFIRVKYGVTKIKILSKKYI